MESLPHGAIQTNRQPPNRATAIRFTNAAFASATLILYVVSLDKKPVVDISIGVPVLILVPMIVLVLTSRFTVNSYAMGIFGLATMVMIGLNVLLFVGGALTVGLAYLFLGLQMVQVVSCGLLLGAYLSTLKSIEPRANSIVISFGALFLQFAAIAFVKFLCCALQHPGSTCHC